MNEGLSDLCAQLDAVLDSAEVFVRLPFQGRAFLLPVAFEAEVCWQDLLFVERQKQAFAENLQRFLSGKNYNHVLLWGARGTGKSSMLRAAFAHFQRQGFKLLQFSCDDLPDLGFMLWFLKRRKELFLVFIDDLSFAVDDGRYRFLKALFDGSVAGIGRNVLLCVTSNRRHLLGEVHHLDQAIHPEEEREEQVSLAERFGLRLAFHSLSQAEFLKVVAHWAERHGVVYNACLERSALQFALARGSRSARVARQFIFQC